MKASKSISQSTNKGRVITRYGADILVEIESGDILRCTSRRKLDHIACGDWVIWEKNPQGNASVTKLLKRHNALTRPDFRGKLKAIAANIDLLVVVMSWRPRPSWEMLDRYLVAASQMPCEVVIVMNKADLREQEATEHDDICLAEYQSIGYNMLEVQAKQGIGIDAIQTYLGQRTAILAGQSGVGKSSIATQLLPETDIRIGEIGDTGEGRHTTTTAMLYHLDNGGALIDSPGVRDFPLPPIDNALLQQGYPEFREYQGYCRFNNCTHQHEPHCAIKQAVENGEIPYFRYQRYLGLLANQDEQRSPF